LRGLPAWNRFGIYLGAPWSSGTWTVWLIGASWFTAWLGSSAAQMVLLSALSAATYLGMYCYLRVVGMCPTVSGLCSVGYLFNPWSELFFGGNYPLFVLLALAPLYSALFLSSARISRFRRLAALCSAALSFSLLATIGANPALVALFVLCTSALIAIGSRWLSISFKGAFPWARTLILLNVTASAWWLFLIANYFAGTKLLATGANDFSFVVARASLLNVLRLNPLWGWSHAEYFPYARAYDGNPLTYVSGFYLAIAVCLSLTIVQERRGALRLALFLFLFSAILSKGLHPPLSFLNSIFYALPGSSLFREPTSKFELIMIQVAFFLLAATLQTLLLHLKMKRHRILVCSGLAVVILASAWPTFAGELFHGATPNYHSGAPGLPSQYVNTPSDWLSLAAYLDQAPHGGVLVLPVDTYYQVNYNWGFYGADYMPTWLLNDHVMVVGLTGYSSSDFAQSLANWLNDAGLNHDEALTSVMRDLGFRYVLFRHDVIESGPRLAAVSDRDLQRIMGNAKQVRFGALHLYDLGPAGPDVSVTRSWYVTNAFPSNVVRLLEVRSYDGHVPRVLPYAGIPPGAAFERNLDWTAPSRVPESVVSLPERFVSYHEGTPKLTGMPGFVVSRADIPVANDYSDVDVALASLSDASPTPGNGAVQTLDAYSNIDGSMALTLLNPGSNQIAVNLNVGLPGKGDRSYELAGSGHYVIATSVGANEDVETELFRHVVLAPGETHLIITANGSTSNISSFPKGLPEIGMVKIASPVRRIPIDCASNTFCGQSNLIGSLTLNVRLQDLDSLSLPGGAGQIPDHLLVRIDLRTTRGSSLSCFAQLHQNGALSFFSVFEDCLGGGPAATGDTKVQSISIFRPRSELLEQFSALETQLIVLHFAASPIQDFGADIATMKIDQSSASVLETSPGVYQIATDRLLPSGDVLLGKRVDLDVEQGAFLWSATRSVEGVLRNLGPNSVVLQVTKSDREVFPYSAIKAVMPAAVQRHFLKGTFILPNSVQRPVVVSIAGPQLREAQAVVFCGGQRATKLAFMPAADQVPETVLIPGASDCHLKRNVTVRAEFDGTLSQGVSFSISASAIGISPLSSPSHPNQRAYTSVVIAPAMEHVSEEQPVTAVMNNPLLKVFTVRSSGSSTLLSFSQTYSQSWLAFQNNAWTLPRHLLVDGWRNGWMLSGKGGTIVIIQLEVCVQVFLLLAGIIAIGRASHVR